IGDTGPFGFESAEVRPVRGTDLSSGKGTKERDVISISPKLFSRSFKKSWNVSKVAVNVNFAFVVAYFFAKTAAPAELFVTANSVLFIFAAVDLSLIDRVPTNPCAALVPLTVVVFCVPFAGPSTFIFDKLILFFVPMDCMLFAKRISSIFSGRNTSKRDISAGPILLRFFLVLSTSILISLKALSVFVRDPTLSRRSRLILYAGTT